VPNLDLVVKKNPSSFRQIAIGTWRTVKDPSVYGSIVVEADAALAYIEEFREATGRRLTLNHVMAKVCGMVLAEMPDANAVLRFGRIYLRQDIGVFFQVALEDPVTKQIDLSGVTVRNPEKKSMIEILDDFERAATRVRAGKDEEKEKTRQTFKMLPGFVTPWLLDLISFLTYDLNLDLRWAGLPKDPFGSVMVTNVGSLGLEEAFVPLVPYSKVPLLIAMGATRREVLPSDKDGEYRVATMLPLCATFDHRILDGAHAAKMSKVLRACFARPHEMLGPIPAKEPAKIAAVT
jgi:pyruvate/2-oxoglutarate dehydrogenase complex dihydrolipoamide acyltransferase (E2) component